MPEMDVINDTIRPIPEASARSVPDRRVPAEDRAWLLVSALEALAAVGLERALIMDCLARQCLLVCGVDGAAVDGAAVERGAGDGATETAPREDASVGGGPRKRAAIGVLGDGPFVALAVAGSLGRLAGSRVPLGASLSHAVIQTGQAELCRDTAADPRVDAAACAARNIASTASVPLTSGGRMIGVVTITSASIDGVDVDDMASVEQLNAAAGSRIAAADELAGDAGTHATLRAALDAAIDGHSIYTPVVDDFGVLTNLRNAYMNPAAAKVRGVVPAQWQGLLLVGGVTGAANPEAVARLLRVARSGQAWRGEATVNTISGPRRYTMTVVPTGPKPSGVMVTLVDVEEQVLAAETLAASEEQFRMTMENSPIGLAVTALNGQWIEVNQAFADLLGYPRAELQLLGYAGVTHPDDLAANAALVPKLIDGSLSSARIDKRYIHADGHTIWAGLHLTAVRFPDGSPRHLITQVVDVTDRWQAAERLSRQARTDPLTQLPNRRAWEEGLLRLLESVAAGNDIVAVAILDLDHFKNFNDTFGHPVGDVLLREAAVAWEAQLSSRVPGGLLARLGGEEFGLALPGTDSETAKGVVRALLDVIPRGQTASAGITMATAGDEAGSAMTRADAALYAAKNQGRNRFKVLLDG